jgi:hypothetical protein
MYICYCCYMFRPHIGHHQETFVLVGDHCTVRLFVVPTGTPLLLLLVFFIGCFKLIVLAAASVFFLVCCSL